MLQGVVSWGANLGKWDENAHVHNSCDGNSNNLAATYFGVVFVNITQVNRVPYPLSPGLWKGNV
jgi:hypothetical protein